MIFAGTDIKYTESNKTEQICEKCGSKLFYAYIEIGIKKIDGTWCESCSSFWIETNPNDCINFKPSLNEPYSFNELLKIPKDEIWGSIIVEEDNENNTGN